MSSHQNTLLIAGFQMLTITNDRDSRCKLESIQISVCAHNLSFIKKKVDWTSFREKVSHKIQAWSRERSYIKTFQDLHKQILKDLNSQVNKLNEMLNKSFIESCPSTYIRKPKKHIWWTKYLTDAETELIKARNNHENDPLDLDLQTKY